MLNKITDINIKPMPEGLRIIYTYSTVDEEGRIIDTNAKGTFVVLDNLSVEVDGENKNVKEAINVIFKASESRLPK